jgi:hypothetical protein
MSKQKIVDPVGSKASAAIMQKWMDFYNSSQAPLETHLRAKYPRKEGEDEGVYGRAIKARVFDIMRGFLPAGITTQLSWHTNLRQAHDKIALLHHHPLAEVRQAAEQIHTQLKEKYPHSFGHQLFDTTENYRAYIAKKYSFYTNTKTRALKMTSNIKAGDISSLKDVFTKRPLKTSLPNFVADLGNVTFEFLLDFGSFRDIQRHRNGVCRMPLLTTNFGFHEWYLAQLRQSLKSARKHYLASRRRQ